MKGTKREKKQAKVNEKLENKIRLKSGSQQTEAQDTS
jgi:hypothetical protein